MDVGIYRILYIQYTSSAYFKLMQRILQLHLYFLSYF